MKQFMKGFIFRGLMAASGGPLVLAIVYGILGATGVVSSLPPREVCLGVITITILAFTVAGMSAIYELEQLPLASAIGIHGAGLYFAYILIYLINGWLKQQLTAIVVFTAVFIAGYGLIWFIIYTVTKVKTNRINRSLSEKPQMP